MKIERICIGGWFQRNMLHLTEIYDFLRDGTSRIKLDPDKLQANRELLDIKDLSFGVEGFENIIYTTNSEITVKIFEDGLIVLDTPPHTKNEDLHADIDVLTDYYENKLSRAINYVFSLGAPVPKELANIKTVYPYFVVVRNATSKQLKDMLLKADKQKYSEFKNANFEMLRGDKHFLINIKKSEISMKVVEKYIEEHVFFREFKGQLHRYLNLHRHIWEEVAVLKEQSGIKGKDINKNTAKLEDYAKTINLVETRINQMSTYLKTREKIAHSDTDYKNFLGVTEYRYETLGNTLSYIQQIWGMTKNYVNSAKDIYKGLQSKITQKALNNLAIISAITASASLIALLARDEWPQWYWWGLLYFGFIIVFGVILNRTIRFLSSKGKYKISDKTYTKIDDE